MSTAVAVARSCLRLGQIIICIKARSSSDVHADCSGVKVRLSLAELVDLAEEWGVDTTTPGPIVLSEAVAKQLVEAACVKFTDREHAVLDWCRAHGVCHNISGAERLARLKLIHKPSNAYRLTAIGRMLSK